MVEYLSDAKLEHERDRLAWLIEQNQHTSSTERMREHVARIEHEQTRRATPGAPRATRPLPNTGAESIARSSESSNHSIWGLTRAAPGSLE